MYSVTFSLMACLAYSKSSYPENMTIFTEGYFWRTFSATSGRWAMHPHRQMTCSGFCFFVWVNAPRLP